MLKHDEFIEPITESEQQRVIEETNRYIQYAADYYERTFNDIPVLFDLTGRAAGMYRIKAGQRVIRYNPYVFSKYFDDNFSDTIPHEVAHYVTDILFGLKRIRPHGREWKSVMQIFGVAANRTANYDLSGLPMRKHQIFIYHCGCQNFELTSRRHNKIIRGTGHYLCRECGSKLRFVKNKDKTG